MARCCAGAPGAAPPAVAVAAGGRRPRRGRRRRRHGIQGEHERRVADQGQQDRSRSGRSELRRHVHVGGRPLVVRRQPDDVTRRQAGAGGGVAAFAINREDGSLKHLNTQPSMGSNPVGVIIDKTNSRVLVANHGAVA